ncbi:MAG: methionine--tRNA ligase, partial [Candidatus Nanohaloarchaea archaeon]|nr:methionine--tRNA ligase [Candidatus Nanohaloarchaea archaeon]
MYKRYTSEVVKFDMKKKVVTSALPYIHGAPHLGNIVGSILPADIYHRFLDIAGVKNIFICGSDEHGTPLELAAIEEGEEPAKFADKQHKKIKKLLKGFNMDFSLYGRTHTRFNREQTHEMFKNLYRNGYITEKEQDLPYCLKCERFLPDRYIEGECPHCGGLARGDQCDEQKCGKLLEPEEIIGPYCTICGYSDIEFRQTKNLFLKLPEFEEDLLDWLQKNSPVPDNLKQEVLNLIEEGLEDRCITRDIEWGFEVPTEEFEDLDDEVYKDKVLYVWFDAPIGYIGITRQYFESEGEEESWKSFWQGGKADTIYSIGKDNTIFHTVIWPAILLGQEEGYNLPDYEFIQQYLLSKDVQFSKSRGTGLTSEKALELLPADYWRFYLASVMPVNHDSKFSWKDLESKINGELNDTVGNYVNRVLSLAEKWFDGKVPEAGDLDPHSIKFLERVKHLLEEVETEVEHERNIKRGLKYAVKIARHGDEFLAEQEPWKNEGRQEDVIYACIDSLRTLAASLYPYTPEAAEKIWSMLYPGEDEEELVLEEGSRFEDLRKSSIEPGKELGERKILFEKIDSKELEEKVKDEGENGSKESGGEEEMDKISFDDFQKMDLRTATIKEVRDHPNADKLYILKIDVGGEVKQSCAG